jgi:thiol-disulfide isomerase/thioredoxin
LAISYLKFGIVLEYSPSEIEATMVRKTRNGIIALVLAGLAGTILTALTPNRPKISSMPDFGGATGWINSAPLTGSEFHGKVILVEFWTYTCVNWRRTLPYVRAWAERYKEKGLVVIGVHTPEFSFEKDSGNVRRATKDMDIRFPVALDNNYAIWSSFANQYWPALYFIDAKGRIRHTRFGEGDYDQSEKVIQQLLMEAGARDIPSDLSPIQASGAELAADWANLRSTETYLGYQQTQHFSSPGGAVRDKRHQYLPAGKLGLNQWALLGDWTMGTEGDLLNAANGRLTYRFHARDVNLIMGPAARDGRLRFVVRIDGLPPGNAHGVDTDKEGNGVVTGKGMYQLIRQPGPITDRLIEVEFPDAGIEIFDLTFG